MKKRHELYGVWCAMKSRCSNQNHPSYANYGGRGISVCPRWDNFDVFVADMGDRPHKATIERKDNNKGYGPDNCRWATRTEQGRNKRNNVLLTIDGETLPVTVWSERFGVAAKTIYFRLKLGWSSEDAVKQSLTKFRAGVPSGEPVHLYAGSDVVRVIANSEVDASLITQRIRRGWSVERATMTPARTYNREPSVSPDQLKQEAATAA